MNIISNNKSKQLYCRWLGVYFICLILGAMNIGPIGSLLRILALIPVAIWALEKHTFPAKDIEVKTLLFVGWCILSTIWSIQMDASIDRSITQITFGVLILSAGAYDYDKSEIEYLKSCLVWSSRVAAVLVLISADYLSGRLYLHSFVQEDPNYLCGYFMFAISSCLSILLQGEKGKNKALAILELVVYMYIIFATGSRGGMLAVIICAGVIILFTNSGKGYVGKNIIRRGVVVIVMIVGYFIVVNRIDSNIINRYTYVAISQSNGTGRFALWQDALNAFMESNFFRKLVGYGTASARSVTYAFNFHEHNVLHNIYLEYLVELGSIGALIYISHIASFFKKAIRAKDLYSISILSGMVVLSMSTSIYAFKPYWNIMLFILCTRNLVERTAEDI